MITLYKLLAFIQYYIRKDDIMREALLMNLKGFSASDLQKTIDEGIASKEETILIGLGVLFEEYYNSLDNSSRQQFLQSLSSLL
mgnify:CR=1 FL=1